MSTRVNRSAQPLPPQAAERTRQLEPIGTLAQELISLSGAVLGIGRFQVQQAVEASTLIASVATDVWAERGNTCLSVHRLASKLNLSETLATLEELPPPNAPPALPRGAVEHGGITAEAAALIGLRASDCGRFWVPVEEEDRELSVLVRRHRPRSLARKFHEAVRSMVLPDERWLVASGLDLTKSRTVLQQVSRGLLGLDRSVRILPRMPIETEDRKRQWARFAFQVGEDEIEIVPELYAKLALYAAFRERDHALLMTLKGHAITWLKEQGITFREGYPPAVWSAFFAWVPGALDEAVMRMTASPRLQEKLALSSSWVNGGIKPHLLGLASWWSPLYHLARILGLQPSAAVPSA